MHNYVNKPDADDNRFYITGEKASQTKANHPEAKYKRTQAK